jgi:hypothetical protein
MWKVSSRGAESSQDGMMFQSFLWLSQWFSFFSLHDFQTQSATLKLVERLARCDVRQRLKFWGDLESLDM